MNELEKQIKEKMQDYNAEFVFKAGCDFILEKNLTVLFSDWLDEHCQIVLGENGMQSTQDIYDYWLNNVYGKEK